jgi:hypothetical protein
MFQFVRRMLAALLNRPGPSSPPESPCSAVREPRRRNPGGRSATIALAEPEPQNHVRAVGMAGTRRSQVNASNDREYG